MGGKRHHGEVVTSAAAAAVFNHYVGVGFHEPIEQVICTEHEAEGGFVLAVGGQVRRARLGNVTVKVPFNIINRYAVEGFLKRLFKVIKNGGVSQVKHILASGKAARSVFTGNAPVGVGAVKVAIGVNHFRLNPNTELHTRRLNLVNKNGKAIGELFGICEPIAKAGSVMVTGAEPTVVHNKHIHAVFYAFVCKVDKLLLVNIEIAGLPSVKNNRAFFHRVTGHDSLAYKGMHFS